MKSTLAKLMNLKWKGIKVPWAQNIAEQYVAFLEKSHPSLATKLKKWTFAKLQ